MAQKSDFAYITEWKKKNTKPYYFKLQNRTDADILKRLSEQSSMQDYIKRLIREDMSRQHSPD